MTCKKKSYLHSIQVKGSISQAAQSWHCKQTLSETVGL
jgi:hypothetical protein